MGHFLFNLLQEKLVVVHFGQQSGLIGDFWLRLARNLACLLDCRFILLYFGLLVRFLIGLGHQRLINLYGLLERIIQNFFGNQFKLAVQGRFLHPFVAQLPNIICPFSSDLLFPDERGSELLLHVGLELQFGGGAGPVHLSD